MSEPTYLELLERRIALADSLSASLLAASSAVVAVDLDAMEFRIAQQREICASIDAIDEQMERLQASCDELSGSSPLKDSMLRLQQAQARVREANSAHQALLSSSRRTVTALLNSLRTFENSHGLYAAPGSRVTTSAEKV